MDSYFDLGSYTRKVSTKNDEAQIWFNRGLNWCYGFNHEEGVKCFEKALEHDPECAMAHWGIAYGSGPFYNLPWRHYGEKELIKFTKFCNDHVKKAISLSSGITTVEKKLINALSKRFQENHPVPVDELDKWDNDYADAMRNVYQEYPDDLDVMALFAEALMTRTPWQLWDIYTGQPKENSDVVEAITVIEKAIKIADERNEKQHPAILHLHIHATEMSSTPEDALKSADVLGTLCPDAGHMNHMPGHTYVLCGKYEEAKIASEKAIRADRMYLEYAGPFNFYTTARCHDLHLMMYTCMFLGQYGPAFDASEEMRKTLSYDVLSVKERPQLAMTMEGYYSMSMHVMIRFGKWQEITEIKTPEDPQIYPVTIAMHHYAKAIAFATLGNFLEADEHRSAFYKSLRNVSKDRQFFNNKALTILGVAEMMMEGEVEYHKGNHDGAYEFLREAVIRNDNLAYTEPWAWMHPPRHALGALLMEQGHYEEAEAVYRTDLGLDNKLARCLQHHDNIWSLHGLAECLKRRNDKHEINIINDKLSYAMSKTDMTITSSCCCRKKVINLECCSQNDKT